MSVVEQIRERTWAKGLITICITTLACVTGPILFLVISTIVESLQPGYDRIQKTISMLVLGPYGWLQTIAFLFFGLLVMVFAMRLYYAVARSQILKIGIIFLTLIGVGFLIIGIFPTQEPGTTPALHAAIHGDTARAIALLFPLACFLIAPSLRTDSRWKNFFVYTLATGLAGLILSIAATLAPTSRLWSGLQERILLLNGLIWVEVISFRLLGFCLRDWHKA